MENPFYSSETEFTFATSRSCETERNLVTVVGLKRDLVRGHPHRGTWILNVDIDLHTRNTRNYQVYGIAKVVRHELCA